jgi:hypothetical protein
MHAFTIVGWTGDADLWCMDCARVRFKKQTKYSACNEKGARLNDPGWHNCGEKSKDGSPCHIVAFDDDDNEVEPIFCDNADDDMVCGRCGKKLLEA